MTQEAAARRIEAEDGAEETARCAYAECGTEFVPGRSHARFCSPTCRKKSWEAEQAERRREEAMRVPWWEAL